MEIYKVGESIDSFNYKQAQEDIVALLDNGSNLVLDMSNCKYISSSGLRVLLYSKKVSASKGLTFSLVSVKPEVKEIMGITGFDNFFDIYATMEECIEKTK
jgi:anti-anti-sigma factor